MPRDLFGDVTRPSISIGNRKWYTVPLSLISHSAIVLVIVAIPILAPAMMPSVFADDEVEFIRVLPPPLPPPLPAKAVEITDVPPDGPPPIPVEAPSGFAPEKPPVDAGWEDRATGTVPGPIDIIFTPPPPPEVKQPPPVRVGGGVRTPIKTRDVSPVYPALAQAARVQGIVIIEATIGADGRVINARILRSVQLLDQAALDAVRQWEFTPTLLNGVPVPVIMTVTVHFTLK
jgi:protein TonB